ncbi:MAG: VWA domain-containing protein [Acidimicrobiales bacterium]
MGFLVAWRLWALVGVGALAGAWVATIFRRRRDVVRFTNVALLDVVAPERPGWRRHLPAVLWLLALVMLVTGFARPVRDVRMAREQATVVVAMDVSLSMEAVDVDPSRVDVAKAAALEFVEQLPEGVDVALVTFSGTVASVPPGEGREAVVEAIEEAELSERTAIGEAIFAGLDVIESAPPAEDGSPTPGRIVVLSDGERTTGRTNEEAAEAAVGDDVPVDTIAFGTPDGEISRDGETEPVPVAPEPLQDIAATTGGEFYAADSLDALTSAYQDVSTVVGYEDQEREIGAWFLGAGLVALGVAGLLSVVWSQRLP